MPKNSLKKKFKIPLWGTSKMGEAIDFLNKGSKDWEENFWQKVMIVFAWQLHYLVAKAKEGNGQ